MKRAGAFVGALATIWTSGACADWQYTRWGMKPDQVLAAASSSATRFFNPDKNNETSEVLVSARYTGAGISFKAFFRFEKKTRALNEVELESLDPEVCHVLVGKLSNTYGQGIHPIHDQIMDLYKWFDRANGNVIIVTRLGYQKTVKCLLIYQPYQEPGSKGGL